ncbi:MAG: choice-of-anchor D domain-containing protein, partial [Myxococcota bacterium]|nr:choice-of-anchor D domain-containing protein [Myxococcota bacterium]
MSKRLLGCVVLLGLVVGSGIARANLSTTPVTIDVGTVRVGDTGDVAESIESDDVVGDNLASIGLAGTGCARFTVAPASGTLPRLITIATPLPIAITFAPTARGLATCQVSLRDGADNPLGTFELRGTGVAPVIAVPAATSFGAVRVLDTATTPTSSRDLAISNTSTDAGQALTITALAFTGSDYSLVTPPTLPTVIAPGGSLVVAVRFDPSNAGARAATLDITSNDPSIATKSAPLTGTGTTAVIGVSDVAFGSVANGTTEVASTTVTNTATSNVGPLRIASAAITGATWLAFDTGACAGETTCPFTALDLTTSTAIALRCTPPAGATGSQLGALTLTSDTDAGGDSVAAVTCSAG